jgi:hypothetical protein
MRAGYKVGLSLGIVDLGSALFLPAAYCKAGKMAK